MPDSPLFKVPMLEGGSDYPTPDAAADSADINDMFKYAEQFWGVQKKTSTTLPSSPLEQQLVYETDTKRFKAYLNGAWVTISGDRRGPTSLRDIAYPTPSDASARVAQANALTYWLNTDKGYEQQYFAAFNDLGAGATTPVKSTAGWYPAQHIAEVPISTFTVTGATPANVTKRGTVCLAGPTTSYSLDGCFTNDFQAYRVLIELVTTTASADVYFNLRAGGTTVGAAMHDYNRIEATAGGVASVSGIVTNSTACQIGRTGVNGTLIEMILTVPGLPEWKRYKATSADNDVYLRTTGGYIKHSVATDGFAINIGGSASITQSRTHVFGVNRHTNT